MTVVYIVVKISIVYVHLSRISTRTAGGWEDSPTQTGSGAMAAGRGESPEPDVLALILSPSSSDEEPD